MGIEDRLCELLDPLDLRALFRKEDAMKRLKKPELFFNVLRRGNVLGPVLDKDEVQGCEAILDACGAAHWPTSWTAYALATAYHETAHSMQPIKEMGGTKYFMRMYDISGNRPKLARDNGNTQVGDGAKYYGRGYVQLTWKNNYKKAEDKLGIEGLVKNPDLALDPDNAADIMISGMQEGWFSGKACDDYLPKVGVANLSQFTQARRIINGTDKAGQIANYALHFQEALVAGMWE